MPQHPPPDTDHPPQETTKRSSNPESHSQTSDQRPQIPDRILLTGRPGVGKTTVVLRTVERLQTVAGGFYTEEMREAGRRVGFRVRDIVSGEQAVLSHVDVSSRHRVGKYGVDVETFERVGVAALEQAFERKGCIVIDEVGKMELCSHRFRDVVEKALAAPQPLLATVPAYRLPFTDALKRRSETDVIEITRSNRETLPDVLAARLNRALINFPR